MENLIIHGADVLNAFAEAPAPKQGFFIRPDKAFHDWWVNHKHREPIAPGAVIPVLSAMQGTLNCHDSGNDTQTGSFGTSGSPLPYMNPVFIQD
jgi:hypothetical protein